MVSRTEASRRINYRKQDLRFLPGWNSVASSELWHRIFEISGIFILGLLVIAEVLAYVYGQRHSTLVSIEQTRIAQEEKAEKDDTARRNNAETQALKAQLDEARNVANAASSQAQKANESQQPRRLRESEKAEILSALTPFSGQAITFTCNVGDVEGHQYMRDFMDILTKAGWTFDPQKDASQSVIIPPPAGVQITVNENDARANKVLVSAKALMEVLHKIGVANGHTLFVSPEVPSGQLHLVIGSKTIAN